MRHRSFNLELVQRKIAQIMLSINATTFREKAYTWASGMQMHTYNDNRMLLGSFRHRLYVMMGFVSKILSKNLDPNYILGTSMSGIPPAASVAQHLNKKLLIRQNGKYLVYKENLTEDVIVKNFKNSDFDSIVVVGAEMIPYGVQYANEFKKGFAYMRQKKDHGKKQWLEGNIKPGAQIAILHTEDENIEEHAETLRKEGYHVDLYLETRLRHGEIQNLELFGKEVNVIEDLFSTGGSAAEEVMTLRNYGAICNYCFSIFSYEFDVLKKQFSGESELGQTGKCLSTPCTIDSILNFSELMKEIKRTEHFSKEIQEAMAEEIGNFDQNYQKFLERKEAVSA